MGEGGGREISGGLGQRSIGVVVDFGGDFGLGGLAIIGGNGLSCCFNGNGRCGCCVVPEDRPYSFHCFLSSMYLIFPVVMDRGRGA